MDSGILPEGWGVVNRGFNVIKPTIPTTISFSTDYTGIPLVTIDLNLDSNSIKTVTTYNSNTIRNWIVPPTGVQQALFTVIGGKGGNGNYGEGGNGGKVTTILNVKPYDLYIIFVGTNGQDSNQNSGSVLGGDCGNGNIDVGYNGGNSGNSSGGGGGASVIFLNSFTNPIIVAAGGGGGGGGGSFYSIGGSGNINSNGDGGNGIMNYIISGIGGIGGATQSNNRTNGANAFDSVNN